MDCSVLVPSTKLPINLDNRKQRGLALPQYVGGCSPQSIERNLSKDTDLDSFLSHRLADGTKSDYRSSFNKFSDFCQNIFECSKACKLEIVAQYLMQLYEEGCSYSNVNFAIFHVRLPSPTKTTYNFTVMLEHIKGLKCNSELSL